MSQKEKGVRDIGGTWAILILISLGVTMPAKAQQLALSDLGSGFEGAASVDTAYAHTDNFFFAPNGSPRVGSGGYVVRPNLFVDRKAGDLNLNFQAKGVYAYSDLPSTLSGYNKVTEDGLVNTTADWQIGTRNRLNLYGEFQRSHDALGALRAVPSTTQAELNPDEWNQGLFNGKYRLGAQDAAFNLELRGSYVERTYLNNRVEDGTEYLDFKTANEGTTLYYNYSPKTSLLLDYNHYSTTFDQTEAGVPNTDNTQDIYRVGVQWKATAKTTGDVRIGYSNQRFDQDPIKANYLNWIAAINWVPAARTSFRLQTNRTAQESYITTGANEALTINNRDSSLEWVQIWGTRVTTFSTARYIQSDFIAVSGSTGGDRHDTVSSLSFSVDYAMVKYLNMIASVTRNVRESNFSIFQYETTVTYVGIRLIP